MWPAESPSRAFISVKKVDPTARAKSWKQRLLSACSFSRWPEIVSHVHDSLSFVRKCRRSWLAHRSPGRRVTTTNVPQNRILYPSDQAICVTLLKVGWSIYRAIAQFWLGMIFFTSKSRKKVHLCFAIGYLHDDAIFLATFLYKKGIFYFNFVLIINLNKKKKG